MKWIIANIGVLLLMAFTVIAIGPLVVLWWATRELSWATTLPITTVATSWILYLYQRNTAIRRYITGILASLSNKDAKISIDVRFAIAGDVDYPDIEGKIRSFYANSDHMPIKQAMIGQSRMSISVDGMPLWLLLSASVDDEVLGEASANRQDLLISMYDLPSSICSTKKLIFRHLQPLLDQMQADFDLRIQAVELRVVFERDVNPYLSAYFQIADLHSISSLKCVLTADEKGSVTLARDAITFSASDLIHLRNMVDDHLVAFCM